MDRIFQSLSEGLAKFVYGWLMPSAVAIAVSLFLLPDLASKSPSVRLALERLPDNGVQQVLAFGIASAALATFLSLTLATPVTRLLEGYYRVPILSRHLQTRHVRKHQYLETLSGRDDLSADLALIANERFFRYPRDVNHVLPTSLGNRLRAAELYGDDIYDLNTLDLWRELVASAPQEVRTTLSDERSAFDFFIATFMNSIFVAIFAGWMSLEAGSLKAFVCALLAVALLPMTYIGARSQSLHFGSAIRSLVNLGRMPLSRNLGYFLPRTISQERRFWAHLAWGTFTSPGDLDGLDAYRSTEEPGSTAA